MIVKIKCPYCNEEIKLEIKDNKIVKILSGNDILLDISEEETNSYYKKNNIEIG